MHTTDTFFAHVQANGFSGYSPAESDILGDRWAHTIGELFERTTEAAELPRTERRHHLWLVWQWLYCMLAKCESRTIASPPAMHAAGIETPPELVNDAIQLLLDSQNITI